MDDVQFIYKIIDGAHRFIIFNKKNRLRFLYGLNEVLIEPYYITMERSGSKVIYGKVYQSSEIKKFNYNKIVDIKVLEKI